MFYEKLKENRQMLNLSKQDLADKLKVSKQTVAKWETGISMPDIENLVKLSELFNVSTDYLLKDTKSKSDFAYYTVVEEKKKSLSPFKLLSILVFSLSAMTIITLFVVSIIEPIIYVNEANKEFTGFLAYCLNYSDFLFAVIFLFIVLILAVLAIIIPDEKIRKIFGKKI